MNTRTAAVITTLLISTICSGSALAQNANFDLPVKLTDENGVDQGDNRFRMDVPLINFGSQIRLGVRFRGAYPAFWGQGSDSPANVMDATGATYPFPPAYYPYASSDYEYNNIYTPFGPTVWRNPVGQEVNLPDGRSYKKPAGGTFIVPVFVGPYVWPNPPAFEAYYDASGDSYRAVGSQTGPTTVSEVDYVDGEKWTVTFQSSSAGGRIRRIASNRGFIIQYRYVLDDRDPLNSSEAQDWLSPSLISGGSLATNYCDLSGISICSGIETGGQSVAFSYSGTVPNRTYDMTWSNGKKLRFAPTSTGISISVPGTSLVSSYESAVSCDNGPGVIKSVTRGGKTWSYAYWCGWDGDMRLMDWNMTRTNPDSTTVFISAAGGDSFPFQITDELNRQTQPYGDNVQGLSQFIFPLRNWMSVGRDARNNPVALGRATTSNVAVPIRTATYPSTCTNLTTCNRPTSVSDANGNTTDYTYDPVHGGVLTETGPAVNGVRPQKRYTYGQRYAWLKNSSGGYSQSGPFWVLLSDSFCRTSAASGNGCSVAGDEVVTTYDYGPDSGPNNLFLRGMAVTADGVARRTCYSYDEFGNKISETSPMAGLASCS